MATLSPNSSGEWRSFPLGTWGSGPGEYGAPGDGSTQSPADGPGEKNGPVPPKRIVICCDGTWQSSVTGRRNIPSNITRLARSIARTGTMKRANGGEEVACQQIVFYSSGVGTGGGVSMMETTRQALFGDGLVAEVIKAYNFVVMNYTEGDEVFCFGFSRGAYTARSVAGLITDIGIIKPCEMDDFPDLFDLYRNHPDSSNFRRSAKYRRWITGVLNEGYETALHGERSNDRWLQKPHTLPPESSRVIQVVGVFDTVGALGIPDLAYLQRAVNFVAQRFPYLGLDTQGFHNTSMSKYIKHAFHALALDEHIRPFTPTLWHLPQEKEQDPQFKDKNIDQLREDFSKLLEKGSTATEQQLSQAWSDLIEAETAHQLQGAEPVLRQVWFPGGHINIGGGNPAILKGFAFDFEQIALITFAWMCDQVKPLLQLDDVEKLEGDPPSKSSSLAAREMQSRRDLIHRTRNDRSLSNFWPVQFLWWLLDYLKIHKGYGPVDFDEEGELWATGTIFDIFDILGLFAVMRFLVWTLKVLPFMSTYRTPGEYYWDPARGEADETNEQIHPSVYYRQRELKDVYKPQSLKGFSRQKVVGKQDGPDGHLYRWSKGGVKIPEYMIKSTDHISRHLIKHSRVKNYITTLMEVEYNPAPDGEDFHNHTD